MSNQKTAIILGSARSDGNTRAVVNFLASKSTVHIIDLNDYKIGYFDYDNINKGDDFMPLMKDICEQYQRIIFATPVYWYSMSAIMKTFFDRISDLLYWEKDLGRTLRGKSMGVVSCSGHDDLKDGFDMPFRETADYLGMHYLGHVHSWVKNEAIEDQIEKRLLAFMKTAITSESIE